MASLGFGFAASFGFGCFDVELEEELPELSESESEPGPKFLELGLTGGEPEAG